MSYNSQDYEDEMMDKEMDEDMDDDMGRNAQQLAQDHGGEFLGSGHATNLDDMDHEQMLKAME